MEPKFYDLRAEQFDDGTIQLTQMDCGEEYCINAHPVQLAYFAQKYCKGPAPALPTITPSTDAPNEMHSLSVTHEPGELIAIEQTVVRGMGGSDDCILVHPSQVPWLVTRLLELASAPPNDKTQSAAFTANGQLQLGV